MIVSRCPLGARYLTPESKAIISTRCHPYARKSASNAVLCRMQLALHATRRTPHGASCLVHAMSAWSVNTRRAPSRHCRDGRVYTTTAMHDNDCTPPLLRTLIFLTSSFLWSNFSSHLVDPVCIIGATFLSIMILVVKLYLLTCCEDNPTY